MNRLELYMALMVRSVWFWTNLLIVVLSTVLISWGIFISVPIAVLFNFLRDKYRIGPRDSIAESTAGYIWGTVLSFVIFAIFKRGILG